MIGAILSGLLAALTLPTAFGKAPLPNLGPLAWIALVPLYLAVRSSGPKAAFHRGFLFGCAFYSLSIYWIFVAMRTYGEVPAWGSALGLALAVMIESFFVALAASLAVGVAGRRTTRFVFAFPLAWVAQDFARNFIPFGGFSWSQVAYTQRSFLTLLQILDLTGVYGVTLLLGLSNALVGEIWLWLRRRRGFPKRTSAVFAVLLIASLGYGLLRIGQIRRDAGTREKLRVVMVQGNIPQDEKWQEEKIEEIIVRHLQLSAEAARLAPHLIVWPEAAYPAVLPPELVRVDLLDLPVPLLMGVVTYEGVIPEAWPPQPKDPSFALHNSAVVIEPGGYIADRYDKNHLVPMGEYVPLQKLLFFLDKIVPAASSFTPGRELNLMRVGARFPRPGGETPPLQFGVTICYEDLFPEISRSFTRRGADFLVNLTNDGWYEYSSAVFQHFDFSRYRAIENRRSMVRATNTGVTGFFGSTGEVLAEMPPFEEGIVGAEIPLGGVMSLYTRFGDLFAWGCVGALGLLMVRRKAKTL